MRAGSRRTPAELKPIIDRVFPFADVAAAQEYSKAGRAKGKIILET